MLKKFLVLLCGIVLGYWLIYDFNPGSLKGKRVFITGASEGIGEQIAYQYVSYGASVVITARRENKLKEVIAKCIELGSDDQTYDYIVADMINLDGTENVVETAVQKLGGLDVVVLIHVFYLPFGYWEGSKQNLSSIVRVMQVNFESYIHLASHALPHLERTNGSITVVNSVTGKIGSLVFVPYSSAKFALDGFFSAVRQELLLRNSGVTVTQCFLGLIGTQNFLEIMSSFFQQPLTNYIPPASSRDAAAAIVTGISKRQRDVIYPGYYNIVIMLRDWMPQTIDYLLLYVHHILMSSN